MLDTIFTDCGKEKGSLLWWLCRISYCGVLWFSLHIWLCTCNHFFPSLTKAFSGRAGHDISQRPCTGNGTTKWCVVGLSKHHTSFCLHWYCIQYTDNLKWIQAHFFYFHFTFILGRGFIVVSYWSIFVICCFSSLIWWKRDWGKRGKGDWSVEAVSFVQFILVIQQRHW